MTGLLQGRNSLAVPVPRPRPRSLLGAADTTRVGVHGSSAARQDRVKTRAPEVGQCLVETVTNVAGLSKRLLVGRPARQRPDGRDAAAEEARAAGLLQRPAVLERVRDRGDPARARPRRAGAAAPDPVGRGRRRRCCWSSWSPSYRQTVPRLPRRRRRVRGQPDQPRPARRAGRGQRAAGRLRDDRRGLGRGRRREHHLRRSRRWRRTPWRSSVALVVVLAADEPARRPGVGHGVRDAHLRVRRRRVRDDRRRAVRSRARPRAGRRVAPASASSAAHGDRRPAAGRCCCCARSPPAARR